MRKCQPTLHLSSGSLFEVIFLSQAHNMTTEEIRAFCKQRVADFKVPKYIKFTDAFPTTISGKIQKYVMREQSIKELKLEGQIQKTA